MNTMNSLSNFSKSEDFNFLREYVKLTNNINDASHHYQEACALYLTSTLCERNFYYSSIAGAPIFTQKSFAGKPLNLWFLFIGTSRISRRSTVIDLAKDAIEAIKPDLLLPDEFTPQYLVKLLSEKYKEEYGYTPATWLNSEISTFFEQLQSVKWMASTDTVLSRIYDGKDYTRGTIGREQESIVMPYMTAMLASTEYLFELIRESLVRQGFINRFIPVIPPQPKLRPERFALDEDELYNVEIIKEWMNALSSVPSTIALRPNNEARQMLNSFEGKSNNLILQHKGTIREGYLGNLTNFLIRLASIHRISRMQTYEFSDQDLFILPIHNEDVKYGIKYLHNTWDWFDNLIELIKTAPVHERIVTQENYILKITKLIERNGGKMSQAELISKSKMRSTKVIEICNDLIRSEKMIRLIKNPEGKGRPKHIFKLKPEIKKPDEENE